VYVLSMHVRPRPAVYITKRSAFRRSKRTHTALSAIVHEQRWLHKHRRPTRCSTDSRCLLLALCVAAASPRVMAALLR
jgi:hypothetical protein